MGPIRPGFRREVETLSVWHELGFLGKQSFANFVIGLIFSKWRLLLVLLTRWRGVHPKGFFFFFFFGYVQQGTASIGPTLKALL